jgi:hypothetical protein
MQARGWLLVVLLEHYSLVHYQIARTSYSASQLKTCKYDYFLEILPSFSMLLSSSSTLALSLSLYIYRERAE